MIGRRRQRQWTDLAVDPQTPLMVGRLLGANEMAVALLQQTGESENARHIAEVLSRQTGFFFESEPQPEPSSAVTETMRTLGMGEQ